MSGLSSTEVVGFLQTTTLFAGLAEAQLHNLAALIVESCHETGSNIVTEGQQSDRLYLIASGEADVLRGVQHLLPIAARGVYLEVDNIRILPADGLWHWTAPATAACPGTAIPLYVRGDPDIAAGLSHRDQIPIPASRVQWMLAHRARDGAHVCGKGFAGEGFHGAFDTLHTSVFSPWSNPPARTWTGGTAGWGFEITGKQDGVITIAIAADGVTDAPARRHLGRSSAGATVAPR